MNSPLSYIGHIFRKKRPIQLTFFLTRRCNAKCPFCFYLRNRRETINCHSELSLKEIERISRSMGNLLWIVFSGGEIYLRKDLVETSITFYKNNKPAILTYPTNGLLPEVIKEKTEDILKHCRKSVVVVKLSLDGLGDAHDALRQTPGNFEKLMQTYEALGGLLDKYSNLEIGINTLFCSENQDRMNGSNGIIEFVQGLNKVRTHTISMVRGELKEEQYKKIDLKQYDKAIRALEKNLKKPHARVYRFKGGRFKAVQDNLQRRLIYQTMSGKRRLIPCYAGRLNLVLTETGDLYPCELSDQKIGNVRDFDCDVKRILQSARAKKVIEAIEAEECYCSHEC
ncbi:MAG: radical SAM protein, partial [Deltaproteobacteria bacterium]|nr:radical SAM protein [Deltaproteobacteria bacterium]